MKRAALFGLTFTLALVALHRADNPPPTRAEIHAARADAAIARANAQIDRTRVTLHWLDTGASR